MLFGRKKIPTIKFKDLMGLALRMFKVNPRRMVLTILGIGISFSTIFFLISLGYGLQALVLGQISSEAALLTLDVQSPDQTALPMNKNSISAFKAIPHVTKVDPIIILSGQVESDLGLAEATFNGTSPDFFNANKFKITKGRFPKEGEKTVTVSSALKQLIVGDTGDVVGKELKLSFTIASTSSKDKSQSETVTVKRDTPYQVVGVTDDGGNTVYVPFNEISDINVPYGSAQVLVDKTDNMDAVKGEIAKLGFVSSSIADTIDQANKVFTFFRFILVLFGIASLVVAVIGMVNTMTIILLERTREIGIMKIFGITQGDIQKLFMFESLIIGFLGGASGLLLGFMFAEMFNLGINILAGALGGQSVNLFVIQISIVLTILVFAAAVGLGIGFFPSRKAAKIDPLIALSYSK